MQRAAGVVGDDPDNVVRHVRDPEARANGIAALKELSRERLVDDCGAPGARVDCRERASRAHRHAERREESLADLPVPRRDRLAAGRLGGDGLPRAAGGGWNLSRRRRGGHPGDADEDVDHLLGPHTVPVVDAESSARVRVGKPIWRRPARQYPSIIVAVTTSSAIVTAISKTTSVWRHRWRIRSDVAIVRSGFVCSRRVSYSAGATPAATPVKSAMTAVCKRMRMSIDRSKRPMFPPFRTIQPRNAKVAQTPRRPPHTAARTDSVSSERTMRPRAGADGRADGDLVLARRPLRDHQNRHIGAGDEERQQDRGAEHVRQDERHLVSDGRALEARCSQGELTLAGGHLLRIVRETVLEPGLERGVRRTGRAPHDHPESRVRRKVAEIERRPDRRVHVGEPEPLRHHADDGVRPRHRSRTRGRSRRSAGRRARCHTRWLRITGGGPLAVEAEKEAPSDGATPRTPKSSGVTARSVTLAVRSPVRISRSPSEVYAAIDGPTVSRQPW